MAATDRGLTGSFEGRVLVVIPALNESGHLGSVLDRLIGSGFPDVVVIDDNSDDDTSEVAVQHGAVVLPLAVRLGAWGATQAGIRYGVLQGFDIIVTMDADGQHHPDDVPAMIRTLQNDHADVVIGSYPDRGSPARHAAWSFFRMLSGIKLEDLTSGLKVYGKRASALLARADATIFDYQDLGVLLYLIGSKLRLVESEVIMSERQDGKSRIFSSWLVVGKYMLQTMIICLSLRIVKGSDADNNNGA